MAAEKVCVPAVSTILPLPLISPLKVPVALVMVRVLEPKAVVPVPDRLTTLAPEVALLISKLLLLVMPLELAMASPITVTLILVMPLLEPV